jgi:(E)-4-hydroxy-3-methylbut-2-enyl-diphosphate synthase
MENEVIAGREILNAARDLAKDTENANRFGRGAVLVSCPRCGRNSFDSIAFAERWKTRLYGLKKDCTIAIMGCAVNGPEEARHADIGITGAGNSIMIFRNGKVIKTFKAKNDKEIDRAFEEELYRE